MINLIKPGVLFFFLLGSLPFLNTWKLQQVNATQTQQVTVRFASKVGDTPFSCDSNYNLGKSATTTKIADFRFYISNIALIDANGKIVPLNLTQDNKWQYQNVALIDFEDKTGACTNGTTEIRNKVVGTVPKGNYRGLQFTLGVPSNLNHEDSTLAPSPLNLTSLWWNWRFGYKFARIDLKNQVVSQNPHSQQKHKDNHRNAAKSQGFPIHLGSTGCQAETSSQKPQTECSNPNRSIISFTNFNPAKNVVIADIGKLLENTDLNKNQADTPAGCMSSPDDNDCRNLMESFGIPFGSDTTVKQTFFRVE
ncbi:MbnP family copper-binding protein [Mastigocoleus testarum]|uniref:Copper-binding protein MbnP-like domain-containing protein n=1 Tax=Mastigocoleus testarum BC008 TaxID=371196 RepID=A0A0V7ZJ20_9CYAN|nr:MbnP family copper-binding protein [Mastigocoleus testarum]KST64525.1 hypothetical protein BC008_18020 [Mastigocoleus testarum BC008]